MCRDFFISIIFKICYSLASKKNCIGDVRMAHNKSFKKILSNKKNILQNVKPAAPVQNQVQQFNPAGPSVPAVSVIIPMYNAQRYIKSCLASVLNQSLKNLEVICVDDCSTDDTLKIVAEIAQQDSRVRVTRLAKNSGGASEPRNTGMRLSRGKYIAFLDSDDMYTPTAMQELFVIAEQWKADVVHTEQVYFPENQQIDIDANTKFSRFSKERGGFCTAPMLETQDVVERVKMFFNGRFFGWVHNKMYRRDFLMENNITFADLKTSEDIIFYFKVTLTAPRIIRVPNIIYIYRHNPDSITRKIVSIQESLHALTHLMIEGSKIMDDFMMKFPALAQNPAVRQLPVDYIIQQHLIWTQRFYDKFTPAQLDELVRNEMKPYCGDHSVFYAYIYSAIHVYRKKMMDYEKKIHELEEKIKQS